MPKIKLNLSALTVPEKIAKAQQIVTKMTGNVHFPTPTPNLTSVSDAADFARPDAHCRGSRNPSLRRWLSRLFILLFPCIAVLFTLT